MNPGPGRENNFGLAPTWEGGRPQPCGVNLGEAGTRKGTLEPGRLPATMPSAGRAYSSRTGIGKHCLPFLTWAGWEFMPGRNTPPRPEPPHAWDLRARLPPPPPSPCPFLTFWQVEDLPHLPACGRLGHSGRVTDFPRRQGGGIPRKDRIPCPSREGG